MDYSEMKSKNEKAINSLSERLAEVRAGRANPAVLNKVKIDYYGTPTPINQVAGVSVPEARMIVIQPWDVSILKEIKKYSEDTKVVIRNVRRDTIDKAKTMQKDGEVTEDDLKSIENEIQKFTDKYIEEVDKLISVKETEIMSI